ncbi:MAG: hypothetical protein J6T73_05640 [Clostridia bacterium]|nr:hypothetical protein [Clostridia bacterium]
MFTFNTGILSAVVIAGAILVIAGVIFAAAVIIKAVILSSKNGNKSKIKYILLCVFCVLTAAVSWILNFGWLRIIMTFTAIPLIHTATFIVINTLALPYADKSKRLTVYGVLSFITYLSGYLLLPDSGDYGPSYMFFGLIKNDIITQASFYLSAVLLTSNVVFLILQITQRAKIKKTG